MSCVVKSDARKEGKSLTRVSTIERLKLKREVILTGEGCDVLQGCSFGRCGSDDDGVLHGVVLLESLDKLGHSGPLLSHGDIDAVELFLLIGTLVPTSLVQYSVKSDSSFTGLAVTNDQLALTTSDRNHGVDRFEASLDGLANRLTREDTGGLELSTAPLSGVEGTLSVDRVAECIDNAPEELLADGNINLRMLVGTSP